MSRSLSSFTLLASLAVAGTASAEEAMLLVQGGDCHLLRAEDPEVIDADDPTSEVSTACSVAGPEATLLWPAPAEGIDGYLVDVYTGGPGAWSRAYQEFEEEAKHQLQPTFGDVFYAVGLTPFGKGIAEERSAFTIVKWAMSPPVDEHGNPVGGPADEQGDPVGGPVDEQGDPVGGPVDEQGDPVGGPVTEGSSLAKQLRALVAELSKDNAELLNLLKQADVENAHLEQENDELRAALRQMKLLNASLTAENQRLRDAVPTPKGGRTRR